jgi:GTP-binding protein
MCREYQGRTVHLVDTAGIRKAGQRDSSSPLEYLSVQSAMKAIKRAHVVVLVLDGKEHLTQQDLSVAYSALEEGRGIMLAINKCDVMMDTDVAIQQLREWCATKLSPVGHVPIVAISAKTGLNVEYILPAALHCFDNWRTRISTSLLNDWLAAVYRRHPPPRHKVRLNSISRGS